jgi:GNAT superfamily N-acetyltransferase
LIDITRPDDPRLAAFAALLERTFADPDSVLGLDRLREFLSDSESARSFRVLVADNADGQVVGGCVFSYVPKTNCGFSEYLVLEPGRRGQGLGRQLFDRRREILDGLAHAHGQLRCRGLFIEADSPVRLPPSLLEAERDSAMDPVERLRIFGHFGFRRVDVPYFQPPLARDKSVVEYLDLLFAPSPWTEPIGVLPVALIVETLAPIWTAWTSASAAARYLQELQARIGAAQLVALEPLSEAAR